MHHTTIGTLGATSALGSGLTAMSHMYGAADRAECIATIRAGHTLLDTGECLNIGHVEMLAGEGPARPPTGRRADQHKFWGQRCCRRRIQDRVRSGTVYRPVLSGPTAHPHHAAASERLRDGDR